MLYQRPKVVASPSLPKNVEAFNKAKDIHSKMAIYFDENFYSDDRNDENCFMYMYLIFYMLACRRKMFTKYDDYDDFAQFASNTIYVRFLRRQSKGVRYKSVLNYAKKTIGFLKIMWQNKTFREVTGNKDEKEIEKSLAIATFVRDGVQNSYANNASYKVDIENEYKRLPTIIEKVISETPYKKDSVMCKRLYMSCLITLLRSFTLSNQHLEKIRKKEENSDSTVSTDTLIKMYAQEVEESPVVWRLEPTMVGYVKILVNKVKKRFYDEMREIKEYYVLPDSDVDAIVDSAWERTRHINYEDENSL